MVERVDRIPLDLRFHALHVGQFEGHPVVAAHNRLQNSGVFPDVTTNRVRVHPELHRHFGIGEFFHNFFIFWKQSEAPVEDQRRDENLTVS